MEALQAIITRRSTRRFEDRVPSRELLDKVIADGKLSFSEVQPDGEGKIKVGNVSFTIWNNTVTLTVENTAGAPLPSSGGPGKGFFVILGSILLAGAGLLLLRRLRRTI